MNENLLLNKELYRYTAIEKAIADYRNLATIHIGDDGKYWNCRFSNCIYGFERTAWEFENYLICVMNCAEDKNDFM